MRLKIHKGRKRWSVKNAENGDVIELFMTFDHAREFAASHLQRNAIKRLLREVAEVKDEYHGLDLQLVTGDSREAKIHNLQKAAFYRGFHISHCIEDETIYLTFVHPVTHKKRKSPGEQLDALDQHAEEITASLDRMTRWEQGDK